MQKILFLLTDNYPFGHGEPFIENEIEYLSQHFQKIFIVSKNINDRQTRVIPENCEVHRICKDYKKIVNVVLDKYYIWDFINNFNLIKLKKIIAFQFYSKLIELKIKELITKYKIPTENIIIYSYWFYHEAYAGTMLKRRNIVNKVISRAHRYDLYLEENHQPFKNEILKNLNFLVPCSKEGEEYLKSKYSKYSDKIRCSYLGTINSNKFSIRKNKKVIVSCSYLVKVKRVELIVEALSKLEDKNVIWYHIGSGMLEANIKNLAAEKLKKIKYKFLGQLSNKEVLKFYEEKDVTCLINLSSSEGLPVSMMEVQSFGIPIVATNVGGVSEIVNEQTGYLLSANPSIEEIVKGIKKMVDLSENEYQKFQENSYENWKVNFNAKNNYEDFIQNYLY